MERPQQQQQQTVVHTPPGTPCEFTTTQEHLGRALRSLSGVAGRNPVLPILNNVLLKPERGQLRLSTTDLEVGVSVWLPGKLRGESALTVPLKPFAEYVQNLPSGPVALVLNGGALLVTATKARATFQGETAENFPLLPHLDNGNVITLSPGSVQQALDAVLYAVATDDTRPELAGVFCHGEDSTLTLAATDSYRLSESRLPLPVPLATPLSVILPGRAAAEFRRALDGAAEAELRVGENQVLLVTPAIHVVSRRVDGTYPDYAQIIPQKQPTTVEIERSALLRAIRAAAVFSGTAVSRVTFEAGADRLRISAMTPEVGNTETDLPAEVQGESVTIAFNERFLRDALSALPGERIVVGLGTSATPAVFRPVSAGADAKTSSAPTTLALVMPIKV